MITKICKTKITSTPDRPQIREEEVLGTVKGQLYVTKGMMMWKGGGVWHVETFWYEIDEDIFYVWVK